MARAQRVLHGVAHAQTEAEAFHARPSGVLTLTASVAFGKLHLVPVVADFVALHPGLELQLCLPGRYLDPIDEGVDVPLRLCDAPPQNLAAHRLCDIRYAIVASPEMAAMSSIKVPANCATGAALVPEFVSADDVRSGTLVRLLSVRIAA